jgi:pimeloyl-ACP methyl ester carboxylesterase
MQIRELDPYRHSVVTRSGRISYLDVGAGPVALFVHGIATNAYLWRNVIESLAAHRRCIAVDLPLHGQSPVTEGQDLSISGLASIIEDFCDALGLGAIDLVGNDTGGAVAQVFAARNPERLVTFTLTNCDTSDNLPPESFKPVVEQAIAGTLAPIAIELIKDLSAAREIAFGTSYEHPEEQDLEVVRAYLEPCFGTIEHAREFERMLAALDPGDLKKIEPQLRTLTVPTLVVWGTGDESFDVSWAYWLRDTIPGVTRVATVEGARLFFPEERPADLVGPLMQHWASYGER